MCLFFFLGRLSPKINLKKITLKITFHLFMMMWVGCFFNIIIKKNQSFEKKSLLRVGRFDFVEKN